MLEAESTPGPWYDRKDFMSMKIPVTPSRIEPATFRFVAQHLNHYATTVPLFQKQFLQYRFVKSYYALNGQLFLRPLPVLRL
jgi:hypothetical protein